MTHPATDFVLIVDDTPANLAILSEALKTAGIEYRVAITGESGIDKAIHHPPI